MYKNGFLVNKINVNTELRVSLPVAQPKHMKNMTYLLNKKTGHIFLQHYFVSSLF